MISRRADWTAIASDMSSTAARSSGFLQWSVGVWLNSNYVRHVILLDNLFGVSTMISHSIKWRRSPLFRGAHASVFLNLSAWASAFSRWSQSSSNKIFQARSTLSRLRWMRHRVIGGAPSSQCIQVELTCSRRVHDLTGQLLNIPQHPVACGGYSDVWKCDWIKDGTIVKVIRQFRCKAWQLNIGSGCCKGDQAARCK